jgi:hypothetical protein
MKFWNKAVAAALAAILCLPAAGCSGGDKSWAVKNADTKVSVGAYIYNLYSAYQLADSKKTDSSKAVLDQKIENKDAKSWIRAKALASTKQVLLLDKKMKDMKLTLTAAEKKTASDMNSTAWTKYSSSLEKYGIAQSSFEVVYGDAFVKERKIFDAIYGKSGTQAVSDADLKDYYGKNYTDFSFLACYLYTKNAQGSYVASFSDAQKKSAEGVLNGYAAQIKAGKMTMRQAANSYKTAQKSTTDELHTASINLSTDTDYPDSMKTALKAMKVGEVKTVELKDEQMYLLLSKNDAAKNAEAKLKTDTDRESVLLSCKSSDFLALLEKETDALTGVDVNESALNSYDPKMFVSASSAS